MTLTPRWHRLLVAALCALAHAAAAAELPSAFNGKDFAGWRVPEKNLWWRIEGGELLVANDPSLTGSILWTDRQFGDFVIELDFKFGAGRVDSGVFLRNEREQIQIGNSGSLKRDMTASPYIAGKGYPVEAVGVQELLKPNEWNTLAVAAVGADYTVWLNGKRVLNYESPTAEKRGPIGLQMHPDTEMSIKFRRIGVAELRRPPEPSK